MAQPFVMSPMHPNVGNTAFHKSLSLYVGDLAQDVTESHLFEHFGKVAAVMSVRVCRNLSTKRSMGYAYVNFQSVADAEKAKDMLNFSPIKGKSCRIMWSNRNPHMRKSNEANIFIKNLDESIDNKQLHDTFSMFGDILSCKVATDRSGKSKGYGFVHYHDESSAAEAISRVNGMKINDKEVYVSKFQKHKRKTLEWTNLYVKNIPEGWDEEKLKEIFKDFGTVTSVILKTIGGEAEEGNKAKFGFVDMDTHEQALAAIEGLNGKYELPADAVIIEPSRRQPQAKEDAAAGEGEKAPGAKDDAKAPNEAEAADADGKEEPLKRYLVVSRAQRKEDRERELRERKENKRIERLNKYQGRNLYIKNLADTVTDDLLRKTFNDLGAISSALVMTDKNGKSRGFGFVCYSSQEEATKAAKEMNGKELEGKTLFVSLAQPKSTRQKHMKRNFAQGGNSGGNGGPRGMPRNMMMNQMPMNQMYQMYQMYQPGMMQPGMMNMAGMGRGQPMPMGMPRGGYPGAYGQMMQPQASMMMQQQMQQQQQQQSRRNRRPNNRNSQNGQRNKKDSAPDAEDAPAAPAAPAGPTKLTAAILAAASPQGQKNMIGEQLYPRITAIAGPTMAGKVTGMLLEAMPTPELLNLLEDNSELKKKTTEAIEVLQAHKKGGQ